MTTNTSASAIDSLLETAIETTSGKLSRSDTLELLAPVGLEVASTLPTGDSRTLANTVALRINNSREFGMVIEAGFSDDKAIFYADNIGMADSHVVAIAELSDASQLFDRFKTTLVYKLLVQQKLEVATVDKQLLHCLSAMFILARHYSSADPQSHYTIEHLSIDPFALDDLQSQHQNAVCQVSRAAVIPLARPIAKIGKLLHPQSIGIIGVSATKMNFGRIILKNLIASGYDKSKLTILRPEETEIDGVKCVGNLQALEHKLDLLVVAVAANAVYELVDQVILSKAAESVMLIPGGLGETQASRDPSAVMCARINQAHGDKDGGPIFIGGNCLGVVSHPGGYDSWFIPRERLPKPPKKQQRNSALISQSGAFMITRISKNPWLDPTYMAALGNQSDITHGDMISYFANDDSIDTIGIYIEGFRDLDGLHFAKSVQQAVVNGKQVVVYKAGRTDAGQVAARGHTASIAGDYARCKTLLTEAGALVADSFSEFDDLLYIADRMHNKSIAGNRLAAVSGAGFETVGMADSIGKILTMPPPSDTTKQRLEAILVAKRLDALMEVRNPIDINPGADDEAHLQCTLAFAEDTDIDAVVVCLDPMAPSMRALAECKSRPGFDIYDEKSVVQTLPGLVNGVNKPVVGIVDGGPLYDTMCEKLMDQGVCVFRSCERGVNALAKYIQSRLRAAQIQSRG